MNTTIQSNSSGAIADKIGQYAVVNLADNTVFEVSEALIDFYRERPQLFDILPQAKPEQSINPDKPQNAIQSRIQQQVRQLEIQSAIDPAIGIF
jgi:hypothetical protein